STDFVALHPGSTVILVNPSSRAATVTISDLSGSISRALTLGPFAKTTTTVNVASRIRSTEPLSGLERFGDTGKLGILIPALASSVQLSMVMPDGVTGPGYVSWLSMANVTSL